MSENKIPQSEITRVKALGFLWDKRTADRFNGRVITRNGKITAKECQVVAEAAKKFGSGEISMTTRLTMEIQGVPFENIEPLRQYLKEQAGLETGGTGAKVRPVISCKGTTCQFGLIDTYALSKKIHERFFVGYNQVKLPHKFKIAVGGCPNNCVKPDLNDVGIVGQRIPLVHTDLCKGCKMCEKECPMHVAKVVEGKAVINPDTCNHCGRCIRKCPFHAIEAQTTGYLIYLGGRWGKRTAMGRPLPVIFTEEEQVMDMVEKCMLLFKAYGETKERFSDTVTRLGFEKVQEMLLSDELLQRKEEILAQ